MLSIPATPKALYQYQFHAIIPSLVITIEYNDRIYGITNDTIGLLS